METLNEILLLLSKDPVKNLSISGFIENNEITDLKKCGNSLCVRGKSDHEWLYLSCDSITELNCLLESFGGNGKYFSSVEEWMIPSIIKYGEPEWMLTAIRYYLDRHTAIPQTNFDTSSLETGDTEFIIKNSDYKEYLSQDYIDERLKKSFSSCIRINGKLAAWGLTHDDGALGSLHVLNDYRRKGFGEAIVSSLILKCRLAGKTPFAQIEEKNTASINLIKKLGFKEDRRINWIKLK